MPFTTAQTEEWAWERAAVNIAFGEATKALRAVQDWVDSTNPDVPWKSMVKDALDITKNHRSHLSSNYPILDPQQ